MQWIYILNPEEKFFLNGNKNMDICTWMETNPTKEVFNNLFESIGQLDVIDIFTIG